MIRNAEGMGIPLTELLKTQKLAFLYPGQDSRDADLGRTLYQFSPPARRVYREARRILHYDVLALTPEQLEDTTYAQVEAVTRNYAFHQTVKELYKLKPAVLAGYSGSGLISTLVASNAMEFKDAIMLTHTRGELIHMAFDREGRSGELAIFFPPNIEASQLNETLAKHHLSISAVNNEKQIVVGGKFDDINNAKADIDSIRGARTIRIKVEGAHHTKETGSIQEPLEKALREAKIKPAEIPLVGNTNAELIKDPEDIIQELLRLSTTTVQWQDVTQRLRQEGIEAVIEIAGKKFLTDLMQTKQERKSKKPLFFGLTIAGGLTVAGVFILSQKIGDKRKR